MLPCTLFRSFIWEQTGRAAFLFSSEVHLVVSRLMQMPALASHKQCCITILPRLRSFGEIHRTALPHALQLYLLAVSIKHDPTDVCPKWARGVVANKAAAYEPQCLKNRKLGSSMRWFHWTQVFSAPVGSLDCGRSIAVSSKRPSVTDLLFVLSAELTQEISTHKFSSSK